MNFKQVIEADWQILSKIFLYTLGQIDASILYVSYLLGTSKPIVCLLLWCLCGIAGMLIYIFTAEGTNLSYYFKNSGIRLFLEKGECSRFCTSIHEYFAEDQQLHIFNDKYEIRKVLWILLLGPIGFLISLVILFQMLKEHALCIKAKKAWTASWKIKKTKKHNLLDEFRAVM